MPCFPYLGFLECLIQDLSIRAELDRFYTVVGVSPLALSPSNHVVNLSPDGRHVFAAFGNLSLLDEAVPADIPHQVGEPVVVSSDITSMS